VNARSDRTGRAAEETPVARPNRRAVQTNDSRADARMPRPLPGDWPLDLVPDAFASAALGPWHPEAALAEPFSVGDAVRLVRRPPALASLPEDVLRKYGPLDGELFEVIALTLPGQVAIARRVEDRGEGGLQTLYVPVDCVEAAGFAPEPRLSRRDPCSTERGADPEEDFEDDFVERLGAFTCGDCARLVGLPRDIRRLPRRERREYEALIGERFEILALFRPDEVHLARECPGPNGEPGYEVFIMPIGCIEPAEFDPEPEEDSAGGTIH
jgi:hypothetical protein